MGELTAVLAPLGAPVSEKPLGGGTFSAVQHVTLADGRSLAVKASVPDSGERPPLMTYEADLLRTERDLLVELRADPGVPVPQLLLDDFSRTHVGVDVIATQFVPGTSWAEVRDSLSAEQNAKVGYNVGQIFAALHARHGERFGYPAENFALGAATWPEAFRLMLTSVLDDADTWGVDVRADDVRRVLDRNETALAEVEVPSLVHLDLWAGNVLLEPDTGEVRVIVDWERAAYADPLVEFVGSESTILGPTSPDLYAGYVAAGGELPVDSNAGTLSGLARAADARTTLYRLYTLSIQQVEVIPRNFKGDWVADHVTRLRRARDQLLTYALA